MDLIISDLLTFTVIPH